MKRPHYASPRPLFPPANLLPTLLFSTCLCLLWGPTTGWTEETSNADQRIRRMEHEIRVLHQRNEDLEGELHDLRDKVEKVEAGEDPGLEAPPRESIEPESPAPQPQPQASLPASDRGSEPYRGFHLTSEDGRHGLWLGGRITGRFTAFLTEHPLNNEFSVERARLFANAHLFDHYRLRIQVEFSPKPTLKDGYLDLHYVPWLRFRLGQFKAPFSMEYQESHKYIDFAERSIAVDNMRFTGRDIGAMLHGRIAGGILDYQFAVLSGKGENRGDDNSAKDLAGRLVFRPFRRGGNQVLRGSQLGVSATWGNQNADFSEVQLLTVAGTPFVSFDKDTALRGSRSRVGAEFAWLLGPASLKAEWMWLWLNDFRMPPLRGDFRAHSWYVSASYVLTGDEKLLSRLIPDRTFNPFEGSWGALELAARYSRYHTDEDLFRLGMATGTSQVGAFSVALSWHLNELLRFTVHYEHAKFDDDIVIDGQAVADEDSLLVQCQLEF
jgi:phosphate-selective porin OprO/OprP